MGRWTQYCIELYNHKVDVETSNLDVPSNNSDEDDNNTILREEVEEAVKALKRGKSPGIDNIPGELVQAGGEDMITVLTISAIESGSQGKWPKSWTQSLIIALPKKGNLQQCNNYPHHQPHQSPQQDLTEGYSE